MLERLKRWAKEHNIIDKDWITLIHTASDLRAQYGDINPESGGESKRFSQESREALKGMGYVIYSLTGQSIVSMQEAGRKFMDYDYRDFSSYENLRSMCTEVAINPDEPIIPFSDHRNDVQQAVLIAKFAHRLKRKVNGVDAVRGEASDYIELEFTHLDATGEHLFEEKFKFPSIRSSTEVDQNTIRWRFIDITVPRDVDRGLLVKPFSAHGNHNIYTAPLVVPAAA